MSCTEIFVTGLSEEITWKITWDDLATTTISTQTAPVVENSQLTLLALLIIQIIIILIIVGVCVYRRRKSKYFVYPTSTSTCFLQAFIFQHFTATQNSFGFISFVLRNISPAHVTVLR